MRKIMVREGTSCPLCPDHEDDEFVWSDLLSAPMCSGCSYDVDNVFDQKEKPIDDPLVERIENVLGISFNEAKVRYLEESIRHFSYEQQVEANLLRENVSRKSRISVLKHRIEQNSQEIEKLKKSISERTEHESCYSSR